MRYDLNCVKSAVKPQPTNQPTCKRLRHFAFCGRDLFFFFVSHKTAVSEGQSLWEAEAVLLNAGPN